MDGGRPLVHKDSGNQTFDRASGFPHCCSESTLCNQRLQGAKQQQPQPRSGRLRGLRDRMPAMACKVCQPMSGTTMYLLPKVRNLCRSMWRLS